MGEQMKGQMELLRREVESKVGGAKIHKYRNLIARLGGYAYLYDDENKTIRKEFDETVKEILRLIYG